MLIILYVLDSLRYDFVGCCNSDEPNTPHLDHLAGDGVVLTNAYSQTTWTKASAASILTSIYPQALGVEMRNQKVLPESFILLRSLRERGFYTLALSTNSFLSSHFGFENGFHSIPDLFALDQFQDRPRRGTRKKGGNSGRRTTGNPFISSEDLNEILFSQLPALGEDVFVVLWGMDTHIPLFDRDRIGEYGKGLTVIGLQDMPNANLDLMLDLYRGMVRYADRHFGEFIAELKSQKIYDDALIIVCSDHGESFGEHKQFAHSGEPYDEQVHVPLIVKFPRGKHAGMKYEGIVELVDIMPTVLEVAGNTDHHNMISGRSLIPMLQGGSPEREFAYSAINASPTSWGISSLRGHGWRYMRQTPPNKRLEIDIGGLRSIARWIFSQTMLLTDLWFRRERYYDLAQDPQALRDFGRRGTSRRKIAGIREALQSLIERNLEVLFAWSQGIEEAEFDDHVQGRLAALGYFEE